MKTTEQYLAQLMKAMDVFEHTDFTSIESQDVALTELLKLPSQMRAEMRKDCVTTPRYWDCECEKNYIHSIKDTDMISEMTCNKCYSVVICPKCNFVPIEDRPDSHLVEVLSEMISERGTL